MIVPCVIALFLHSFPVYAARPHLDPASFLKDDKVATEQDEREGLISQTGLNTGQMLNPEEDDGAASKASLLKGDHLASAEGQSGGLLQQNEALAAHLGTFTFGSNRAGAAAVDPCEVLINKIVYVKSPPDRELFRQGRLQPLLRGSPFLRVGGLFWSDVYGICKVSEIVNPGNLQGHAPAVKARPMTGEFAELGKKAKLQGTAGDEVLFENVLKNGEVKPLLPGSPIGTFFQTLPIFKGNKNEIEAPPRTGSVISEAWQDEKSEKVLVKVKYVNDGSTAVLEVGELESIFRPGVAIKTIQFSQCSTSWMFGLQGDTSVKVKVAYYSSLEPIQHESTIDIDLKGKIKHGFSLELAPPGVKRDRQGDAVQQGLFMQSDGDSLQTFDSLRTDARYIASETFYAESSPSSDIPPSK